jgi:amidase/aspartyl-tRNA(Asn)/glutamyl-tRNA(Gln) amidotransferase subunit A
MPHDLTSLRLSIWRGHTSAAEQVERSIERALSPAGRAAWMHFTPERARAQAASVDADLRAGRPLPALAGLPFSVKDLFDVAGEVTRAGSRVLADEPPATQHAPAVARLLAGGGSLIGRTHMVEFAFSGVGTNPHYPTPAAFDGRWHQTVGAPDEPRVPGGSSSGAAVSVATGAALIGLGSDTGGSVRIPAALNGIVGFKGTARCVPTEGTVPLSITLDTVGALTRSVRDAILVHELLAARTVTRTAAPLAAWRLAVVRHPMLEALDETVGRAFERSLARLRQAGAQVEEIDLPVLDELTELTARAHFSPVESYAWHRERIAKRGAEYDPRVAARILRGAEVPAYAYIELIAGRRRWIARMEAALRDYDAVLSPTTPIVAPRLADVAPADGRDAALDAARDAEFFRVNALLLRHTSVVNMLDGCALTLPCHTPDELPVGLMLWAPAMRDEAILNLGLRVEESLQIK